MKKVTISNVEQLREALEAVATISAVEAILNDSSVRALRSYAKEEGYYFCKPLTKVTKDELLRAILSDYAAILDVEPVTEAEVEVEVEDAGVSGYHVAQTHGKLFLEGKVSADYLLNELSRPEYQTKYYGYAAGLAEVFGIARGYDDESVHTWIEYSYEELLPRLEEFIEAYEPEVAAGPVFKDFPSEYTSEREKGEIVRHNFIELVTECKTNEDVRAYLMKCKRVETLQEMVYQHYGKLPAIMGGSVKVWADWLADELINEFEANREAIEAAM